MTGLIKRKRSMKELMLHELFFAMPEELFISKIGICWDIMELCCCYFKYDLY